MLDQLDADRLHILFETAFVRNRTTSARPVRQFSLVCQALQAKLNELPAMQLSNVAFGLRVLPVQYANDYGEAVESLAKALEECLRGLPSRWSQDADLAVRGALQALRDVRGRLNEPALRDATVEPAPRDDDVVMEEPAPCEDERNVATFEATNGTSPVPQ